MAPRVSVLMPYRDAAETLAEAMESVLDERGVDLELIAVDDGSRDEGPAIAARIASGDGRVVLGASGGSGIAGALDHAAALAQGELFGRMDADDVSLPGRLAAEAALLDRDPTLGVVGTWVSAFPEEATGEGTRRYLDWMNGLVSPADHARDLFVESPLCHPSVMMRRAALERSGGYREEPSPEAERRRRESGAAGLTDAEAGYGMAKVPFHGLRWRQHPRRATVTDPRYALARFADLKARYLAPRLARPVAVWGAGKTGKRLSRALEREGVRTEIFIDIDPRKIGGVARGAPVVAPEDLPRGRYTVLVALGARGAREIVRARLASWGLVEGEDFVVAW